MISLKYGDSSVSFQFNLNMATESFLCTDCGITFTAKKNLTRHIVLVHAKTQVTCEKCGKHFTREDKLKRHLVRCNPKNSSTLTFSPKHFYRDMTRKMNVLSITGPKQIRRMVTTSNI